MVDVRPLTSRDVVSAQRRLEAGIASLDDVAVRVESACDGWTRGHVLSHLAGNADGLANLATWALTGTVAPMYAPGVRDRDIARGATRDAAAIVDDVVASNAVVADSLRRLDDAVAADAAVANRIVRLGDDPVGGSAIPAWRLAHLRTQEVVLHHHDLLLDLRVEEWPDPYVEAALPRIVAGMARRDADLPTLVARRAHGEVVVHDGGDVVVTASPAHLLAWLTGRGQPDDRSHLDVRGGPLPAPPRW